MNGGGLTGAAAAVPAAEKVQQPVIARAPRKIQSSAEVAAAAAVLAAIMLGQIALQRGFVLFFRPLWLDEVHTLLIASLSTPIEVVRAITRGADYNPPVLHLATWLLGKLSGGLSEVKLRLFALASIWLALVLLYGVLRRHFTIIPAFTGALMIWAHPLTIRHAFDARFYGPWLLATVAFVYLLTAEHVGRRHQIAIAAAAVLLCGIHYYGVFVWLIAVSVTGTRARHDRERLTRIVIPAVAGPLSLVAFLPMYAGQRSALSVPTWIAPLTIEQVGNTIAAVLPPWPPLLLLVGLVLVSTLLPASQRPVAIVKAWRPPDLLVFGALLTLPLILVVLSLVMQPTLIARYTIPSVLASAPLAALLVNRMRVAVRVIAVVIALFSSQFALEAYASSARAFAAATREDAEQLSSRAAPHAVIVSASRHKLYPLAQVSDELAGQLAVVDLPDRVVRDRFPAESDSASAGDYHLLERDVARAHRSIFDFPGIITLDQLAAHGRLLLVGASDDEVEAFADRWLPAYVVERVAPRIYELNRPPQTGHNAAAATASGDGSALEARR